MFDALDSWVSTQLAASGGLEAWLLLFAGGILASLLPCVYPLYPITVAILRGRNSRLGRAAHPLAYYAGLAGMYMAFGVIAALTGGAFNELIRTPAFNLVVGAVLAALAGSVVGVLEFPTLTLGSTTAERDHRLVGTVAMGAAAGLLSSACVGPVVVSILVGLVVHAETITPALVVLSSSKMLVFGLGVGLPVVLLGVFGLQLPKAGRWTLAVQWVFGLLIGFFALGYTSKGLVGLGLSESAAQAVEFGALLLLGAAFLVQDRERPTAERGRHAFLVLAAICGFFVMARGLLPVSTSASEGPRATQSAQTTTETEHGLTWYLERDLAYEEAARTGKMVFIDFYGSWCTNCKAFQEEIGRNASLRAALGDAVLLKIYDTSELFRSYRDDERFPELSVGLPFFVITDARGNVVYKTSDFTKTDEMMLFLEG